jgi:uncharacterized protein YjbI with pentapeptide repeats
MSIPTKLLSLAAVILLLATPTGCDSGNGSNSQALTEIDFANNPSLRADPDKGVIVDFLESPGSDTPQNDTGPVGIDEIPVTYTKTETHTFCWKDDNSEAMHYMAVLDSEGSEILRVDVNGECVMEVIEAGDYVMAIHHDGRMETTYPIFIIPHPDDIEEARETDGLIDGFKVVIANIVNGIRNTVSKDARAQTVQENINTLIISNRCPGCVLTKAILVNVSLMRANLSQADLRGAILISANLSQADLRGANLSRANLREAKLSEADLFQADFREANLESADLHFSNLSQTDLREAILISANLVRADLSQADLTSANLSRANLIAANLLGANLEKADLSLATWCHGCICIEHESINRCAGCPPVEEVCTGT